MEKYTSPKNCQGWSIHQKTAKTEENTDNHINSSRN